MIMTPAGAIIKTCDAKNPAGAIIKTCDAKNPAGVGETCGVRREENRVAQDYMADNSE